MPSTRERVPIHTADHINRKIRLETEARVRQYARRPHLIEKRLKALDEEWDIERAIEMNASALAFTGVALGFSRHRNWLLLPAAVTAFLFQHAVQGWCPPVPILRRLGFRTVYEIERERHALKAIRGDFDTLSRAADRTGAALEAVRRSR